MLQEAPVVNEMPDWYKLSDNITWRNKVNKDSARMVKDRSNFSTQYSQETLQEMNDDRLEALKSMLKGKIFSLSNSAGKNADAEEEMKNLQVEHSYVSRELEVRHNRKKMHEEYLQRTRRNKSFGRRNTRRHRD